MANDREFEPDFEDGNFMIRQWWDTYGHHHDTDSDREDFPDPWNIDMVGITVQLPDGTYETRNFAGPFNDWDEVQDAVEYFIDMGTPA